jgi:3-phenylpropionate/cinnamic acid dioxygenase small subunit
MTQLELRPEPTTDSVLRDIERLLYLEARLLDRRRFDEWLNLLTNDIRYWMPVRTQRYPRNSKAISVPSDATYIEEELGDEKEFAYFDEDKGSLTSRVVRLKDGMGWSEDPPSRVCRAVTNVEAFESVVANEFDIYCNLLVYRSRAAHERETFVAAREDRVRLTDDGLRICARKVLIEDTVMSMKNLSIFL